MTRQCDCDCLLCVVQDATVKRFGIVGRRKPYMFWCAAVLLLCFLNFVSAGSVLLTYHCACLSDSKSGTIACLLALLHTSHSGALLSDVFRGPPFFGLLLLLLFYPPPFYPNTPGSVTVRPFPA